MSTIAATNEPDVQSYTPTRIAWPFVRSVRNAPDQSLQSRAVASALQGLSPASRRVYSARIHAYLDWSQRTALSRESVRAYMRALELRGSSPQVRNQALAALKRLASEAAELGWIPHNDAAQIARIRSKRIAGTRSGLWLDAAQLARLLALPDRSTIHGRRDACLLALLIGCGLRRAEACALETAQLKTVAGRMVIRNLTGKGGRVRSVSVPQWAQRDIERWMDELKKENS
jgi:site-specific recombinase XerD